MELVTSLQTSAASTVAMSNPKMGMSGVRLMNRKEYREANQLTRAEAERKHNAYLRTEGIKANVNIASRIAGGQLLITGIKEYESGKGQIAFVSAAKLVDKVEKAAPVKAASDLSQEELCALIGITSEQLDALKAAKK